MVSLVDFLRKRLMLGSQCPSVEEEAEWYIKTFEAHMRQPDCADDLNYQYAVERAVRFLKGKKETE